MWFAKVEMASRMCPHVLAELVDQVRALRNPTSKSNGLVEMWTSDEMSSGLAKRACGELAENSSVGLFLLTSPKNSATRFELLKRANKKVDRQTRSANEKRSSG